MKLSNELVEKAKKAASAEELRTLAGQNGMELSASEAAGYFSQLNKRGELSDEELSNVAGGGCQVHGAVQPNATIEVGDKFRRKDCATKKFAVCSCGNDVFRATAVTHNYDSARPCIHYEGVCTRCGKAVSFFNNYGEAECEWVAV